MTAREGSAQQGQTGQILSQTGKPRPAGYALRLRHNVNPSIQSHACIRTHVIKGTRI